MCYKYITVLLVCIKNERFYGISLSCGILKVGEISLLMIHISQVLSVNGARSRYCSAVSMIILEPFFFRSLLALAS
jgi:flagellar assembly factor FliW